MSTSGKTEARKARGSSNPLTVSSNSKGSTKGFGEDLSLEAVPSSLVLLAALSSQNLCPAGLLDATSSSPPPPSS